MNIYIIHWDNNQEYDDWRCGIEENGIFLNRELAIAECDRLNSTASERNEYPDWVPDVSYTVKEYQTQD